MDCQQWFYGVSYSGVVMRVPLAAGHSGEQWQSEGFKILWRVPCGLQEYLKSFSIGLSRVAGFRCYYEGDFGGLR